MLWKRFKHFCYHHRNVDAGAWFRCRTLVTLINTFAYAMVSVKLFYIKKSLNLVWLFRRYRGYSTWLVPLYGYSTVEKMLRFQQVHFLYHAASCTCRVATVPYWMFWFDSRSDLTFWNSFRSGSISKFFMSIEMLINFPTGNFRNVPVLFSKSFSHFNYCYIFTIVTFSTNWVQVGVEN